MWLGNDDDTAMNKVTGGSLPAAAWRAFMLAATKDMPVKPLPAAGSGLGVPADGLRRPPTAAPAEESPFARLLGWLAPAAAHN